MISSPTIGKSTNRRRTSERTPQVAARLFAAIIQNTGCVKIEHSEVKGQTQFSVTGCDIPRGYDRISNIALAMTDSLMQAEEETRPINN